MSDIRNARVGTSPAQAAAILCRGGIVAFPTETFYGLAVDPFCESAVAKLFEVKQRPAHKPLLLLINRIEQLREVAAEIPRQYQELMNTYWPGPLTLIFPAKSNMLRQVTANTGTVGVRISPHPVARELVRKAGRPITATSANPSGMSPAKSALEVLAMFQDKLDYILDGGETVGGGCSTVVGLEGNRLVLMRSGRLDLGLEKRSDEAE